MIDVDEDLEYVDCACYTGGRRHPEVMGSLGATRLPFQITAQSLGAFAVTGAALVLTWINGGVWTWLLPTPLNAALCAVLPLMMGVLATYVRVDGRNPISGGLAFVRYGVRSRQGVVAGRSTPRRRTYRMSARGLVAGGGRR